MGIIDQLSSSQNRRDQNPNKALARDIVLSQNSEGVVELSELLHSKDDNILFDVLKVLEMIGENDPELIKDLVDELLPSLSHKKNKITWMCMSALSTIAHFHYQKIHTNLNSLLTIMDAGSVITRDRGMVILIGLYGQEKFRKDITPLILEQLLAAPDNQLGQYVEKWMAVVEPEELESLIAVVEQRMPDLINDSHIKRAEKNLMKLRRLAKA